MSLNGSFRGRVIHLIRHAESEFNVLANHQTEGFIPAVTKLDANLTKTGFAQAESLGHRIASETINGYHPQHPKSPRNAQIVITSPLSRAILTATHSMPFEKYQYLIRPEISEQIENTTDLPASKTKLMVRFPELRPQISSLPDAWWHRHPSHRANGARLDPQRDADLLHSLQGQEPAAESKEILQRRVQWFFDWLNRDEQRHFGNIAVYSHCCTIFEMERFLRRFGDAENEHALTMPQNTEIRSFALENVAQLNDDYRHQTFENYYTSPQLPHTSVFDERAYDTAHSEPSQAQPFC